MTDAELDFPHEVDPSVRSVGPMVFVERHRSEGVDEDSPLQRAFVQAETDGHRLIYCSVTTVGGADLSFLSRIKEVAVRRPEWAIVIGLGGKLEPEALGVLPANVTALGWVPQLDVLARADLSINHGGVNTIHECIHFRVPMVVYSGKKHDQNGCAARVSYHGLGLRGDKDLDGVAEIEAKIERVLSEPSFRDNVEAAHARYRAMKGDDTLNRAIAELIAARPLSNPNHSETHT
jgi:UDP:flavonoid glycosyltransferase YjiC (YdhE family)